MVAMEVSVNVKPKVPSNMFTSQVSNQSEKYIHNLLQSIQTPIKPKKWLSARIKHFVDARMLKTCLGKLLDLCHFITAHI